MAKKGLIRVLMAMVWILGVSAPAAADVLILRSGEMFDVQDVREENNFIYYIKDHQAYRIPASEVERIIRQSVPAKPEEPPPETAPSSPQPPPSADVGFIELKWGDPPSQLPGLVHVGTDPAYGGVDQYVRNLPDPHFGRASVDRIFYGFWEDGLYTILVEVSNYLDFSDLKAEAFRRYGPGLRENDKVDRYRWRNDAATDRFLHYDDATRTGYLWMRSKAIHNQVKALHPDA